MAGNFASLFGFDALSDDKEAAVTRPKSKFYFPRTTLVVEIERRCRADGCGKRNHISLTKPEAIEYRGFNCSECESWSDDRLNQSEMPDSWNDLIGIH